MDDQTLLKRYTTNRDASAFEELSNRHAGFVKSVCQRVLGNSHDAEEVAQECFLELARHADEIHSSVVGWLHRAAMSRSLNHLRSRVRRKVRERQAGAETASMTSGSDLTTRELKIVIDGALTEMPDDLRLPMLLHYFDGRSQRDVALELGVNQSTVSRRMRDALDQLREKLTRSGYVTTAPALVVMMRQQAGAVESGLSDVTVSAVAKESAEAMSMLGGLKAFIISALSLCSLLLVDGWISLGLAIGLSIHVARHQPRWMADLCSSLGISDLYDDPTYPFKRWDWKVAPADWRRQMLASVTTFAFIGALTVAFAISSSRVPWGSVLLSGAVSIGSLIHSLRLVYRACLLRIASRPHAMEHAVMACPIDQGLVRTRPDGFEFDSNESILLCIEAIQLIATGLAGVGLTLLLLTTSATPTVWPSRILVGILGPVMLWSGACLCRRLTLRWQSPFCRDVVPYGPPRPAQGTRLFLSIGVTLVAALTTWIVWNPSSIRGFSLSLASIQTAMLGWMFFRPAVYCRNLDVRLVRQIALVLLISCFVLNSGVCMANCWW
ncbi:RNA polymerase sigma factor [Schlesneria paludicola]|uniref:RNA polymerase sigma factor n=1 Tax=Schlesneria paludicola TaxID=360056 RepID=UPI0012FB7CAF|nr:sigma-70 family RNA polymerase sigma factor [Schlesneria paludicola]